MIPPLEGRPHSPSTQLRGIAWDHERCLGPLRAGARAYAEQTGVEVVFEARSLQAFGDQPVEQLVPSYDLISIDHPFCGTAHELGCLTPLDELLPAATLSAIAADTLGPSYESYDFAGHQWALPTDAACQVAAVRDDLLDGRPAPRTWDEVLALAAALPGRVATPLKPADAISAFLSLCANAGAPPPHSPETFADPATGRWALDVLTELVALGPSDALTLDPPRAFDRMTSGDEIAYVPLAYGYSLYAVAGGVPHPCRFLDVPSSGHGPRGAILGGSGLAVSAASADPHAAAAYAAWMSGPAVQRDLVGLRGGQPGSASAWDDLAVDEASGGFMSATRATLTASYLRPREPWWPPFQLESGRILNSGLAERRGPDQILDALDRAYRDALA